MELLIDLVRSLPNINTAAHAVDAIKMGVQTKNHYQIWCTERFHMDGSRCALPEDLFPWDARVTQPRTMSALRDLFKAVPGLAARYLFQGNLLCCPLIHHKADKWKMDFYNLVVTVGRNELLDRTFTAPGADVLWYVGLIGAATGTIAETAAANAVTGTSTTFSAADVASDIIIVGAGTGAVDLLTTVATFTSATSITTTANAVLTVTAAPFAVEPRPADTMSSKSFNETAPYSNSVRPTWTRNAAASAGAMSNSSSKATFTVSTTGRAFGAFLTSNNTKSGTTGTIFGGGLDTVNGSRSLVSGDSLATQIDLSVTAS